MADHSVLQTSRLTLRPLSMGDARVYATMIGDWTVAKMLGPVPYPFSVDDAEAYIALVGEKPWHYAIATDRLIGCVTISDHLGYWLGQPYWRNGYGTEAARAAVDAYFDGTDDDKIISGAFADNPASQHLLTKLGFEVTGRSRVDCRSRGVEIDHVDMLLTRQRYNDLRSAR